MKDRWFTPGNVDFFVSFDIFFVCFNLCCCDNLVPSRSENWCYGIHVKQMAPVLSFVVSGLSH